MYGGKTLKSRLYVGELLSRAYAAIDEKLIITYETEKDLEEYGKANRDSDAIYQQLQSVEGVEAIVLLRYDSQDEISVGLRSKLYADVGALAGNYGGGGHKNAAGFTFKGTVKDIESRLIADFSGIL